MSPRTKKLAGTILILIWLPLYAVTAMQIGVSMLPGAGPVLTFLYYAVTGMAWIVPIGFLLPWMHREPQRHR
jgi:Protein of unknown function (DUF2842)